jgi:Phosphate-selective porin O and P
MMRRNLVNWSAVLAVAAVLALALPAMAETAAPDPADAPKATAEATKPAAEAPKLAETELAPPKGMTLKIGDSAWFKFGGMLQGWADWNQDPVTEGYIQNLFLRRTRFNLAGKVTNGVYFYFQTENASLGKSPTKSLGSGFQTLDAVLEWRINKAFNVQAGLIYVPDSREAIKSSVTNSFLDTSAYATLATAQLQGNSNRDTGAGVRGFVLDDHLEYRVLALQGVRDAASRYSFRWVGRLSYNFFDREMYSPGFTAVTTSYNGTTKKILAVGTSYDTQKGFRLYSGDIFASIPFKVGRLELGTWYQSIDGGSLVTTLPRQNTFTAEAGWYFEALKTAAWGRYERRQYSTTATKDEKRYWGGLTYYVYGNNLNLKAAYQRLVPAVGNSTNDLTLAIQMSY